MSNENLYYPDLTGESHKLVDAIHLLYDYQYQQSGLTSKEVVIRQNVVIRGGGSSSPSGTSQTLSLNTDEIKFNTASTSSTPSITFSLGKELGIGTPKKLVLDFSGNDATGAFTSQKLYIGDCYLGANRKEIYMGENNGVLTISGCKVCHDEFTGWRIGEPMGAAVSMGGENANGELHLVYGGLTASSVGETSGRAICARVTSTAPHYAFLGDAANNFQFRYWISSAYGYGYHTGGTSATNYVDSLGRNLVTVFGLAVNDILHNRTDGSFGIVASITTTSATNDTAVVTALTGGSGNNFESGDNVEFRTPTITFKDTSSRTVGMFTHDSVGGDAGFVSGGSADYRGILRANAKTTGTDEAALLILQAEGAVDVFVNASTNGNLHVGLSDPDTNEYANALLLAAVEDVAASSGTITVKSGSAGNADTAGFLGIRTAGGGTIYIPYLLDATP